MAAYRDMAQGSYYRTLAKSEYDRILPTYIDDHLEKATSANFNGRCTDAKQQLQLVLDVDPQNTKAVELSKKPCSKKPSSGDYGSTAPGIHKACTGRA
jgi:hypothetical protein